MNEFGRPDDHIRSRAKLSCVRLPLRARLVGVLRARLGGSVADLPPEEVPAARERSGRIQAGPAGRAIVGRHDRRVVPSESIRETDHENLAVYLSLSVGEVESALELDPAKGVEQGGAARRLTEVPRAELPPRHDAGAPGPVDRAVTIVAPVAALVGTLALLAVFVFWGASNSSDALPYFAVPGVLFAVAALLAYRAWSRPWTKSAAAQRHGPPAR